MGGESSVLMYNNSLILRIQMTEKPFAYKKLSLTFIQIICFKEMVKYLPKLINIMALLMLEVN